MLLEVCQKDNQEYLQTQAVCHHGKQPLPLLDNLNCEDFFLYNEQKYLPKVPTLSHKVPPSLFSSLLYEPSSGNWRRSPDSWLRPAFCRHIAVLLERMWLSLRASSDLGFSFVEESVLNFQYFRVNQNVRFLRIQVRLVIRILSGWGKKNIYTDCLLCVYMCICIYMLLYIIHILCIINLILSIILWGFI